MNVIKNKECFYYFHNSGNADPDTGAHDCNHADNQNYRNMCDINRCPLESDKYCYHCGKRYKGDQCPKCASTIYTEKPNSQSKKE